MATTWHLTGDYALNQGKTFTFRITIPGDYTSWNWLGQVRRDYADKDTTVDQSFSFSNLTYNATTNKTTVYASLSAAQTETMSDDYLWEIEASSNGVTVPIITSSKMKVKLEVARI